jgi:HAD superfamily hydrolase (TIGR01509 family)
MHAAAYPPLRRSHLLSGEPIRRHDRTVTESLPVKPLAAVLFDMDGTLFDSEALWDIAIDELAATYDAIVADELRLSMVGRAVDDSMLLLHAGIGQPWRDAAYSAAWIYERIEVLFAEALRWRPGAQELLHLVRAAGVPTALVTSTDRRAVEVALDTLGRHNFDAVVCGDEVSRHKPDPAPYEKASLLLNVDPRDCVAIEDSPTGVASALAAGARVLGVPHHVPLLPGDRVTLRPTLLGVTLADLAALPS